MADQEEGKIPVFTVLKNGAILKNIFIVNKPPPPISISEPKSIAAVPDHEEVLLVGRHPDCNLLLTHPSISRFHLQILSKPSSQKLFVTDLQSVHGTWVSGSKLEPGVKVELKEGDILRIGGSSRVYRLHWISISRAYDLEIPFVSELDVTIPVEKEEEDAVPEEEKVELVQNEVICLVDNEEIQSLDSILESIGSLFTDENSEVTAKRIIPLAPPVPEVMVSVSCGEEGKSPSKHDLQSGKSFMFSCWPFGTETSTLPLTSGSQNKQCDLVNHFLSPRYMEPVVQMSDFYADLESESHVEEENETCSEAEKYKETVVLSPLREYLIENPSSILVEANQGTEMQQLEGVIHSPPDLCTSLPSMQETSFEKHSSNLLLNLDPTSLDERSTANAAERPTETELECTLTNDDRGKGILTTEADNLVTEYTSMLVEEAILDTRFQQVKIVEEQVLMNSLSDGEILDKCWKEQNLLENSNATSCCEQGQSTLVVQDMGNKSTDTLSPTCLPAESGNSSWAKGAIFAIATKEENLSPQSPIAVAGCSETKIHESCVETKEKNSISGNIWSRRGKASSAPQIRSSKSRFKSTAKVDTEVEMIDENDVINKSKTISRDLFSILDGEEEVFTPDKENLSPDTLQLRFLNKKGILEEIKHSKSHGSRNSKVNVSPNIFLNENMSPTADKENQTPGVAQEQKLERKAFGRRNKLDQRQEMMPLKKNRVERAPFNSLVNSGSKKISETSGGPASAVKIINASNSVQILAKCTNHSQIGLPQRTNWDMIVDTASLLNKESRKALKLLQGLKGTRLIIPRMVIRELDNMKHQFNIFRRTTEASLVLKWIEECMVENKWWIHVQSSMEEERLMAPTPRASPQTEFSEEGWTFSSPKSSMEIVSPTSEDQILDCALSYRRKQTHGQLVLLSDAVSFKIKSMAEGLLCETVQEFRESLVNPFSERFLWANSSPRGLTWSCQDDVVLREKYCRNPLRKSSKGEGAKGLKLILLHNSHYGKSSSAL